MSQALEKNNIKIETDSLTSIATDYFDDSDPIHAGYAWFYRARTASNRDSVNEQAKNLLKAQEYSEKATDNKLRGLVYGDKGIMYKNQLQLDSSIHYFKLAYEAFIQINDYKNTALSLLRVGDIFLNLSKNDSVLKYYFLAEKIVDRSNDTLLISTVYRSLGSIYYRFKDYKLALNYYDKVPLTRVALYDSNKYYLIAKTYVQLNEIDSARKYLEEVTELQNMAPDYYELWKKIYEKRGNTQKYIFYANKVNLSIDSIYKKKLEISFAGLEKKYKYQSLQITNQSLTIKNKQRGLYLLVSLLMLSICIVLFLFWRLKVKKNEVEYQKDIANKKQELLEKEKENTAKEIENSALLERQLKLQNILLSNIKMHQTNTVKRPTVWREGSKDTIEKQYEAFYNELKTYVDMEFNNFTVRLKEKHLVLTENDIFISCLLIAEFETGMMATILNIQTDSMNKQRYRLRTKLKLPNSENLLDYLLHF
ncbi:MAG: tetratricopeptide repeat protein [Paludibacter sp.]|nr:tetratricopeptide repeat protein [Paludibacter sp.]